MAANEDTLGGATPETGERAGAEPDYHLLLSPEEASVLQTALDLAISDFSRDGQIRDLARAVIARLPGPAAGDLAQDRDGVGDAISIPLQAREMKIVHTAVHLLLDDLQREQADEIHVLRRIIDKLPDEHAIRAISLD